MFIASACLVIASFSTSAPVLDGVEGVFTMRNVNELHDTLDYHQLRLTFSQGAAKVEARLRGLEYILRKDKGYERIYAGRVEELPKNREIVAKPSQWVVLYEQIPVKQGRTTVTLSYEKGKQSLYYSAIYGKSQFGIETLDIQSDGNVLRSSLNSYVYQRR